MGLSSALRKLSLVAAASLVAFTLPEGWLRYVEARRPAYTLQEALRDVDPPAPGEESRWLHALQPNENPRIAYGLRPGFRGRVPFAGVVVDFEVNRHGFRGPDWEERKPPGTVRIVGLGDSVMMGYAVEYEQSYLHRLKTELRSHLPDLTLEVLNLAVGGYNTVQEVAVLEEIGLAFEPDLVLLHLVSNDHHGIQYQGLRPSALAWDRSFLFDAVRGVRRTGEYGPYGGWEDLRAALARLRELRDLHGFDLLVFSHEPAPQNQRMLAIAQEEGLDAVDLLPFLPGHMRRAGLPEDDASALFIPGDGHPSALHHGFLANDLLAVLQRRGLLTRLVERSSEAVASDR